ncbi:MAG: U32 family peptidase, partial [Clostridia bacterium]|nr:U32 family peptidase [Clostridia bacterium]
MNMKILSPAGDFESLKMAVFNGADEVYLGVKDFNARNIEGFSLVTLKEAVDFAHVFGVKVNLTVNILFNDDEMQSALDLIIDAYNLGVDSFIIQDLGLASLINKNYPQIEMHASTQMAIHNLEGVKAVEKLGFKRVVLARETPLEEIKRIREGSLVEIEYFCQGALCVSFSGNCYMSSYLHNASGNRGKCKQLCRLPYSLRLNNKEIKTGYLLSAKDFNMLENLKELEEVGVDVLKIEGRARRPYYVGVATQTYKKALADENYDLDDLRLAFNRGYTAGYFNGNDNIISNKQNHIGIEIGKVERFNTGKKFNEIFLSSNVEITPKSVLKFIHNNDEIVITAYDVIKEKDLFRITTTQIVKVGDRVNLISDFEKEQEMIKTTKRRKINIKIVAKLNQPIEARFSIDDEECVV